MGTRSAGSFLFIIGLLSVTVGAVSLAPAPISSMVGYWALDESSGPSLDSSGNGNTSNAWPAGLSALMGAANVPPKLAATSKGCLHFDGATGVLTIPNTAALTIPGDFTVSFWMYRENTPTDWVRLVGKGAVGIRTFGVWLESGGDRILWQQMDGAASYAPNCFSKAHIAMTTWTHVACRISGNTGNVYIDGVDSTDVGNTRSGPAQTDTSDLTMGYAGYYTYYKGRLDDVRVYNSALDITDIQILAAGCPPPQGLTATATTAPVTLNWSAPTGTQPLAGYTYNIMRGTVSGTYPTVVATGVAATTYVDNSVPLGVPAYYVVTAVSAAESGYSVEALAPGPITISPTSGLFTSELPTSTNFNITFNGDVPAGTTVSLTITSSDTTEGLVSDGGPAAPQIVHNVVGPMTAPFYVPITVIGQPDLIADGPQNYTVTVTTTSNPVGVFNNLSLPAVNLTNNDIDTAGITISKTSGLVTTESGGTDSFSVSLTSKPVGQITLNLTNLTPTEVSLSQSTIVFDSTNWNAGIVVVVTGVDDTVLDFTQPWTIRGTLSATAADPAYAGILVPTITGVNLDNEVIPPAPRAWGGSGGGCGLLGLEAALLCLLRRRRRSG
jgi:hypothetical protein